ncbi:hypothetical protein RYA05_03205 [Pseudomonas syringae pv. actinidiae]|nr:hypothetical protein [Pseudomonas syringae pv. actinidiae]
MTAQGFYVDQDGVICDTSEHRCDVDVAKRRVDVLDSDGGVNHEAEYFETRQALEDRIAGRS